MKIVKIVPVVIIGLSMASCDNSSSSSSSVSKSEALRICNSEMEDAVRSVGSNSVEMMRAGERAQEDCMARYGYYPK